MTTACPGYDTKTSDGEAIFLELLGRGTAPSLPLLLSPLWPGVVIPISVQSKSQKEMYNYSTAYKQKTNVKLHCSCCIARVEIICVQIKLLVLNSNTWSNLSVYKQMINAK